MSGQRWGLTASASGMGSTKVGVRYHDVVALPYAAHAFRVRVVYLRHAWACGPLPRSLIHVGMGFGAPIEKLITVLARSAHG
jgi:hypothetical protein